MFSKHPNGLIAAALANMGERFGFYIMMAILTLFISAKFGLSETTTGYIYSAFYASIYTRVCVTPVSRFSICLSISAVSLLRGLLSVYVTGG